MLTLYFVRHGETEWNIERRIQGQLDSDLTKKGIADVLNLKEQLNHIKWQAVYSSPSSRTQHTTKLLVSELNIKIDKRLMEMNLGIYEGMKWSKMKEKYYTHYYNYWEKPECFSIELGEDFFDLKTRVESFITDLIHQYRTGNILIVTHGVVIQTVKLMVEKKEVSRFWDTPLVEGATVMPIAVIDGKMNVI